MKIAWTEPAVEDLRELHAYIARDSEMYASGFVERIISAAQTVVEAKNQEVTKPDETSTEFSEPVVGSTEGAEGAEEEPAAATTNENGELPVIESETSAGLPEASVSTDGAGGEASAEPAGEIEAAPDPAAESNE